MIESNDEKKTIRNYHSKRNDNIDNDHNTLISISFLLFFSIYLTLSFVQSH